MRKLLVLVLLFVSTLFLPPTQAEVPDNLLEISRLSPDVANQNDSLVIAAQVSSTQVETVELWLSRNPVDDITEIAQEVIPLAQARVVNNQVTITRNAMPDVSSGVYQLVLRSISNSSVIGEQAVPIVIGQIPAKELAVLVPISVPPTSNEVLSLQSVLSAGEARPVSWFIDSDSFAKLNLTKLNVSSEVIGVPATNPDPNVAARKELGNLLSLANLKTQAQFSDFQELETGLWSIKHPADANGIRAAARSGIDFLVAQKNEPARKFRYQKQEVTEITVDPVLTSLLSATSNPILIRQYLLSQSVLTNAAAIAPPIGWAPSLAAANSFFDTAQNIAWVEFTDTKQIARNLELTPLSEIEKNSPVFSVSHLRNLDQMNRLWQTLQVTSANQPDAELSNRVVAATSSWWWLSRSSGNESTRILKQDLTSEVNQLKFSSRNKILLPAASGEIPITISNDRSTDAKFQISGNGLGTAVVRIETVQVEIPANTKQVIELPIEVITPGTIYAQLVIEGPSGETTSIAPAVLQVEVSQYRVVAQVVIYGAFGVLILLSLISIRSRVQRRKQKEHN